MKRILQLYLLCAIAVFSSCKGIKNLSSKDTSTATRTKQSKSGNPVFLDGISVTPGGDRTSQLTTIPDKPYKTTRTAYSNFDIETATMLQVKYATVLNVAVEDVTNLPLMQDIDYWWGTKYCMGGSTETCTDCSAFTQNIIRDIYAIQLPRTADQQYTAAEHIEYADIKEGDLVFFQTSGRGISHVGIYLTNNKFAHASVSNGVMISDINEPYWKARFKAAGRVRKSL